MQMSIYTVFESFSFPNLIVLALDLNRNIWSNTIMIQQFKHTVEIDILYRYSNAD